MSTGNEEDKRNHRRAPLSQIQFKPTGLHMMQLPDAMSSATQ
jgi:hypothetical protein